MTYTKLSKHMGVILTGIFIIFILQLASVSAADQDAAVRYEPVTGGGTVMYSSMPASLSNGRYTLLKDVTFDSRITMDMSAREITLDLNGHMLTSTAKDYALLLERNGSESNPKIFRLTSSVKGGTLKADPNTDAAVQVQGKFLNVTIGENAVVSGSNVTVASESQNIDVYGKISVGNTYAVTTNKSTARNAVISIHEPAVIESENVAVFLSGQGTISIDGGSITGRTAVCQRRGALAISGGKFKGTGEKQDYRYTSNGVEPTGDALVLDNTEIPVIAVTGGIFESVNAKAAASYGVSPAEKVRFISGGAFLGKDKIDTGIDDIDDTGIIRKGCLYAIGTDNDVYVEDAGASEYAARYPSMVLDIPVGRGLAYNGHPQMGIKGGDMVFTGEGITGTKDGAFATEPGTYFATAKLDTGFILKKHVWKDKTFKDKTVSFVIAKGRVTATVKGYKGTYDGKEHGISIYGITPEGSSVTYSTDGNDFTVDSPKFTDPGTYLVYYRIAKNEYETLTGSETVVIDGLTPKETEAPKVTKLIEDLPVDIRPSDESKVTAARAAYTKLSDVQKGYVTKDTLQRLVNAENRIQDYKDEATASAAEDVLKKLPAEPGMSTEAEIKTARTAYDALTEAQKKKVDPELLSRLENAEFYHAKIAAREKKGYIISAGTKGKTKGVVTWDETPGADGYQVVVSRKKNFKSAGRYLAGSDTFSKIVKKLKKGTKYYAKVRPYTYVYDPSAKEEIRVYGHYSKVRSFRTKKK